MDLQEEYFLRTQVKAPLVRYAQTNVGALLRAKNSERKPLVNRWKIVNIQGINRDGEPGRFFLNEFVPIYNIGCKNSRLLSSAGECPKKDKCFFDDYEYNIISWAIQLQKAWEPVTDLAERFLGMWEFLVCTYDAAFAALPNSLALMLCETLDAQKDIESRYKIALDLIDVFGKNANIAGSRAKTIYAGWVSLQQLGLDESFYAHWFVDILKRELNNPKKPVVFDPDALPTPIPAMATT